MHSWIECKRGVIFSVHLHLMVLRDEQTSDCLCQSSVQDKMFPTYITMERICYGYECTRVGVIPQSFFLLKLSATVRHDHSAEYSVWGGKFLHEGY